MAETDQDNIVETQQMSYKDNTDSGYFSSYADISIHELMLKDKPRTLAYKHFIEKNSNLFRDKVVVDVGAGTGILALFAAKAGAKKVYAVEASELSEVCEQIVAHNGLDDIVTVLHGRAEDIDLPDGEKADIIISEWMGFYLLHESMLDSVLQARTRWLNDDGIMLPSSATLHLCPVSMSDYWKEHFDYWGNVYGFDFSPLLSKVKASALSQPTITTLKPVQCLSEPELVAHFDLQYATEDDIKQIVGNFNFTLAKNGVLHGFACWFDIEFEGDHSATLSTGPSAEPTHWQQTVILLPDPLLVNKEETICCRLELQQDTVNKRRYNICIEIQEDDEEEDGNEEERVNDMSDDIKTQLMQAVNIDKVTQ